jgi:hypothetical protein
MGKSHGAVMDAFLSHCGASRAVDNADRTINRIDGVDEAGHVSDPRPGTNSWNYIRHSDYHKETDRNAKKAGGKGDGSSSSKGTGGGSDWGDPP